MSSRHSLLGQHSHSCTRSIRTNHLSFRHLNWIHQNCRRKQSGFHLNCRSLNVKRAGKRVEQPFVPSESFCSHPMNCFRHKMTTSRHRMTMSRHRMTMIHLMNCFRHYCLNHRRNHKRQCNGGSSQPVHHSRQTPLLKER